jgi:3D (Asp-Asp-Asp) domain-containing protein
VTATGTRTAEDPYGVAADPRALPYGTQVRIPGYRSGSWQEIDDTGSRLRHSWRQDSVVHLDVRFKTRFSALQWGSRWVDVEIAP